MNPEAQTLQRKLSDINSLLSVVELNHFASQLVERDLLSFASKNSILDTLGYSRAKQVSLLMDAVMAQVRTTPRKFEDFMAILSSDSSLQRLAEDVMKTYRSLGGKLLFRSREETATSGSGEPDLPTLLNEVVAVIPGKWRQVGNLLKIPRGVLDAMGQQYSPMDCFEHVLTEWDSRRTSPYTWETIIDALQSKAVGENALATKLACTYGVLPRRSSVPCSQPKEEPLRPSVQPPAPPGPSQTPTLAELQTFTVNGETVSIITDVADSWKNICVAFNFDPNGRTLKRIEQRYPNQAVDCCREMFQTWLKVQGASWSSLITILESCSEGLLAEHVKAYVSQQKGNTEGVEQGVELVDEAAPSVSQPSQRQRNGGGVCNVSGERAFKTCYPDLLRGIPNDKVDDLIADLYGNDLLTPAERDQLYDSPGGQKTRQLLTTLEKHICADPKSFYTLLQVLESDHRPLVLKLKDKTSKLT